MSEQTILLNQIDVFEHDAYDNVLAYAFCENIPTNREVLILLGATETEIDATLVEYNDLSVIDLSQLGFRWAKWFEEGKWWNERPKKCGWCDSLTTEVSHPHMFDAAIGEKMCKECWNHDREVYKGSYGEDIGEFVAVKDSTE